VGSDLPRWLDEGLAILAEYPAEQKLHLSRLEKSNPIFGARDLFSLGSSYPQKNLLGEFNASSYLLTSFLTQKKEGKKKILDLARFISQGKGQENALKSAFGFSIEELENEFYTFQRQARVGTGSDKSKVVSILPVLPKRPPNSALVLVPNPGKNYTFYIGEEKYTPDSKTFYEHKDANSSGSFIGYFTQSITKNRPIEIFIKHRDSSSRVISWYKKLLVNPDENYKVNLNEFSLTSIESPEFQSFVILKNFSKLPGHSKLVLENSQNRESYSTIEKNARFFSAELAPENRVIGFELGGFSKGAYPKLTVKTLDSSGERQLDWESSFSVPKEPGLVFLTPKDFLLMAAERYAATSDERKNTSIIIVRGIGRSEILKTSDKKIALSKELFLVGDSSTRSFAYETIQLDPLFKNTLKFSLEDTDKKHTGIWVSEAVAVIEPGKITYIDRKNFKLSHSERTQQEN
jgi:hypothetical protein